MKTTLDFSDFRDAFRRYDRLDQFSREGMELLFDYLEECDPDMELDVIALCCDFCEDTPEAVAREHSIDLSHLDPEDDDYEEQCTDAVRDYLNENTQLVGETSTGFVYAAF